jgi:hypothetical protein
MLMKRYWAILAIGSSIEGKNMPDWRIGSWHMQTKRLIYPETTSVNFRNWGISSTSGLRFGRLLTLNRTPWNFPQCLCWSLFYLMSPSSPSGSIFKKCSGGQISENSKSCHNEGFSSIFMFFPIQQSVKKELVHFCNYLVPINIIKLHNNKRLSIINYKVYVCILHASTSSSLTHARPWVWRWEN